MMDMTKEALITLCWELYEQGIPKTHIAGRLGRHRETVHLWIKGIKQYGLMPFLDRYRMAKKGERRKRKLTPQVKRLIWEIREREYQCCGQKIEYFLKQEYDISLSVAKIYQALAEKYKLRSKWKRNVQRGKVPKASSPREVVQMDTIDFGGLFAFTAIDIFTKEADVLLVPDLNARYGRVFLYQSMSRRFDNHVHLVQTDGGPEFRAEFTQDVLLFCNRHRIARPYRKNEQSYIESFNRTVRKECLGWNKYNADELVECTGMVESFLERYHYHRPHMSLNMSPPLTR